MIIATGKSIEEIAANAIINQDPNLIGHLVNMHWNWKNGRELELPECLEIGDYTLCGPARTPPKRSIRPTKDSGYKEHQGQLFLGRNLAVIQSVDCLRIGEKYESKGNVELIVPFYSWNEEAIRSELVPVILRQFASRFSTIFECEPLYSKYIIYESPKEKQIAQDILQKSSV